MDRLMGLEADRHKIVWVQHEVQPLGNVAYRDRVHMMHKDPPVKLVAGASKVAPIVPQDDVAANLLPLV